MIRKNKYDTRWTWWHVQSHRTALSIQVRISEFSAKLQWTWHWKIAESRTTEKINYHVRTMASVLLLHEYADTSQSWLYTFCQPECFAQMMNTQFQAGRLSCIQFFEKSAYLKHQTCVALRWISTEWWIHVAFNQDVLEYEDTRALKSLQTPSGFPHNGELKDWLTEGWGRDTWVVVPIVQFVSTIIRCLWGPKYALQTKTASSCFTRVWFCLLTQTCSSEVKGILLFRF